MPDRKSFEVFRNRLQPWRRVLSGEVPVLAEREALGEMASLLQNLERRLDDGPDAPLRFCFFGPTGVGKSKLFNSLVGSPLSPAGFRRPCTRSSLYYLHEDWRSLAPALPGETAFHRRESWRDLILVDTPDFDSVERDNRREAERLFRETDGFLFVTDSLKYADASTWEYLERIFASGKLWRVILNRVRSREVVEDFESRLARALRDESPEGAWVVIPELAIDDESPIPEDHEALAELRGALDDLIRSARAGRELAVTIFRRELERLVESARTRLGVVRERRRTIAGLRSRLERRFEDSAARLGEESVDIDPAVKQEVSRRIAQRLEAIDVFRYPRKILALPAEGLRMLWRRWRPSSEREAPATREAVRSTAASESFQQLESALISLNEATRTDIEDAAFLRPLITRGDYRRVRLGHDEALELYEKRLETFRDWVAEEAERTAGELTGESKLKFVLSQVIFNSVLIGVQVHTGGVFTLFELGFDGLVSPLVAKAVGLAISSEKVRDFERRAHAEHHRLGREVLDEGRRRFESFLDRAERGLPELESVLEEIAAHRGSEEAFTRAFAQGPAATPPSPREGSPP